MAKPAPTAIEIAAADLLLTVIGQLAASRHPTPDDIRQGAFVCFGAERLCRRLKDAAAAEMLDAAGDELAAIADRRDRWPRLIDLHRELATSSRNFGAG